ncbi:peptidase A24 [Haloprofundus marisrubri]|uniref:Peptidase A24 n=1 Tax=Haloprofundus marisrubri TaxID=1514971 RepID=A0A0W1RDZ7_9EURY|nr:A24 family peptidase [Haloprofundus marisrubri]KTG11649.1 peptidase A24 [Haloprofundus marisrubri]
MLGTMPDLLRLLVVPVFLWAAWRDVKTRRLPNRMWPPLAALGIVLLGWDLWATYPFGPLDSLFLLQVGISVFFVAPIGYAFWYIGGFGAADAKALIVLALIFPTFPSYLVSGVELPFVETTLGVFSFTILTNAVLVAVAYPLVLGLRNLVTRQFSPVMFLGRPVSVDSLSTRHGSLFETPDGYTRNGLDLDALRMYLRWRGTTLSALRADPDAHRDPESVTETYPVGDGSVDDAPSDSPTVADGGAVVRERPEQNSTDYEDPWAAEKFLNSLEWSAYGTTPEKLRNGLDLVSTREEVWMMPGLPFIVPMFVGLLVALTYGDVLFGVLGAVGLV